MSASQFTSRKQVEEALLARAESNEAFRRGLLEDPRAIIAKDFGITIPPGVKITVLEETTNNLYLVLPARRANSNTGELADRELEAVAGGKRAEKASDSGKFSKLIGVAFA